MTYQIGLAISFGFVFFDQLYLLARIFSSEEFRNYRKFNFYYSFWSDSFKFSEKRPSLRWQVFNYTTVLFVTLLFALLSWLYVGYRLYAITYNLSTFMSMPEYIKESIWAFKREALTMEQAAESQLKSIRRNTPENIKELCDYLNKIDAA